MQRAARDMSARNRTPAIRPWLRHANWPADYFPLRRDTPDARFDVRRTKTTPSSASKATACTKSPVGPIHAGIIEPGHFRFSVMGENVLRLEERLGLEAQGHRAPLRRHGLRRRARKLAGRVSGDSDGRLRLGLQPGRRGHQRHDAAAACALAARLLLERERVANHFGDLGYLGNDVALAFGLMQFMRLKEDWIRLNAKLFGHRLLMDRIVPGGVAVDLDEAGAQATSFASATTDRPRSASRSEIIYDEHAGLQDRFLTTGRVTPQLAKRLGVIGLAGRASAQWWDLRYNHPCEPYDQLKPKIVTERNGDVAARALGSFR
jgi:Ni,Fe-hydrogenase III large subunit